tara:strand:- start:3157 stop:3450 length:294 start_codon:yes stop_codon:yes gene_type:complete
MEISGIGKSALIAAGGAARIHANNIVNTHTPNFIPKKPVFSPIVSGGVAVFSQDVSQPSNAIRETVGLISATNQYKAAASLIQLSERLHSTLLKELA